MSSVMPTGSAETFTGADGNSFTPANFAGAINQGGSVTIQGNRGRLRTGTTAGQRTSCRIEVDRADAEMLFTCVLVPLNSQYPKAYMRTTTNVDTQHGYYLDIEPGDISIGKSVSYSSTNLATATHSLTAGTTVKVRFAIFGNRLRARIWDAATSEPTSVWMIDTTDNTWTGTAGQGWSGITTASGSAGAKDFFIDDLDLFDTVTPTQATFVGGGGMTPVGVLLKRPNKRPGASMTPSGVITVRRVVVRVFTAAMTPTATLRKVVPKAFGGGMTPTGLARKRVNKGMGVNYTFPNGVLRKQPRKRAAGAMTPTATLVITFIGRIFGRPGIAVMKVLQDTELRMRIRRG